MLGVEWMVKVYNIMIRCPVTQKPLFTGLQTASPEEFAREIYKNVRVSCPHCKSEHRWRKDEAFLLPEESASESSTLWRPNR
ncbi:MAG: hypothetical protein DMG09_00525 [Acidobacteria bacterium]|nr:MAG: hypothetical protein DMG09_00525 [Acidobacteriota bacterium]